MHYTLWIYSNYEEEFLATHCWPEVVQTSIRYAEVVLQYHVVNLVALMFHTGARGTFSYAIKGDLSLYKKKK